ncbi:MAG: sulfotransferase [Gammaproteobacteria bacterium]|nr:sulfotransferase [Gammaproteobacteria bacterium]
MQAILMVGEQRSGSNLLRLILNSSPKIAAPHPPHILQNMMPLMAGYGDLHDEEKMSRLIDDVCRLVENNPVPWDGITLFDRNQVRAMCRENSLVAVFDAVMQLYARAQGATAWMCKSMQNIRWGRELNAYLHKPKFIYLYRDPRDVALSFGKAVIGDKHPYHVARKWAELQELCLDASNYLEADQLMHVRYEELTSQPEKVIRQLCKFLAIPFIPEMLEFHRSQEATRTAKQSSLWMNLTKPLMSDNSKKFLKDMPEEHIRIIESVTGSLLDRLGYERCLVKPGQEMQFTPEQIAQFDQENEQAKATMAKKTDPEDMRRRQIQANVLQEIKQMLSRSPALGQSAS